MGQVVTFPNLPAQPIADGIDKAAITQGETREMAAELIRIAPGKRWTASIPRGCDGYLFVLAGAASIAAGDRRHRLPTQSFATLEEGSTFAVENDSASRTEIIKVLAPPQPNGRGLAGFRGGIAVAQRDSAARVDLPEQKKKRFYFVDDHAARSERGHAMIVVYEKDTVTGLHHHPNAESLFVVLDGALQFTVNGKPSMVEPGQAAYFGCNDQHGLAVADGFSGASFLEFHIPAAYTTVRAGTAVAG